VKKASLKILIRADSSVQIGTGHVMRCLTLADKLRGRGAEIVFVCRDFAGNLCGYIEEKGYIVHRLPVSDAPEQGDQNIETGLKHAVWLGADWQTDARQVEEIIKGFENSPDWLVVDHYGLDEKWEGYLRPYVKKIMVVDDLADRAHDCDLLLDQNFYADMNIRYRGKLPSHCQLLLGPRYALLRDEFRQLHEQIKQRSRPVKRVLVFFGGVDADNYTGRTIEALSEINISDLHVDLVIGAQHPCCEQIKTACVQHGFICHVQTDKMAELMVAADLAIGAGGSATWERCCLGLPTLTICTADNQQKQITDAAQEGFLYAPSLGTDWAAVIKNHIKALLENDHLRWLLSSRAMQAVDGRGVLRIIGILGCSGIEMRMVNANDSTELFEWRNHTSIRSVSRNTEPITWEDHQGWFADVMGSKNRVLLIGQSGDVPIGVVRFDKQEDVAEVSIYLVPDANHSGQGRNLLLSGEQWIKENRPEIKHIRACVIGGNEPSQRLFLGADYQVEATHYLKKL
jgi:UDP-2,4-diacetamido-2,4,6-trideoxy-beta-L-altropyranose hydrolase